MAELTTAQWLILDHATRNHDRFYELGLYPQLRSVVSAAGVERSLKGLAKRGFIVRSETRTIWVITDVGKTTVASLMLCPACSTPLKRSPTRVLHRHKCEHGLPCTPGSVDRHTRRTIYPMTGRTSDRSRDCKECNADTNYQIRNRCGPRGAFA